METGLKLKVKDFRANSSFVDVTGKKLVGGGVFFGSPILNIVKKKHTTGVFFSFHDNLKYHFLKKFRGQKKRPFLLRSTDPNFFSQESTKIHGRLILLSVLKFDQILLQCFMRSLYRKKLMIKILKKSCLSTYPPSLISLSR